MLLFSDFEQRVLIIGKESSFAHAMTGSAYCLLARLNRLPFAQSTCVRSTAHQFIESDLESRTLRAGGRHGKYGAAVLDPKGVPTEGALYESSAGSAVPRASEAQNVGGWGSAGGEAQNVGDCSVTLVY